MVFAIGSLALALIAVSLKTCWSIDQEKKLYQFIDLVP